MELADVLIRVDVTKFGATDYSNADKLISQGYEAARQSVSDLLKFAIDGNAWEEYLARREARRIKSVPVPSFIQVNGTTPQLAETIERDLHHDEGRTINEARLEQELTVLTGTGRFSSMAYSIAEVDRRFGLRINALEKEYAPPTVNPIVVLDGSQYNSVLFSVGARLTFLDVGKPGAEVRSDILAGSTYRISGEYFRPLSHSAHWFIAPRVSVDSLPLNLYNRNTQLAAYRLSQVNGGVDLGYICSTASASSGLDMRLAGRAIPLPSEIQTCSRRCQAGRVFPESAMSSTASIIQLCQKKESASLVRSISSTVDRPLKRTFQCCK